MVEVSSMFHRSKRDNNRERRETNEVGRKTGECYCSSILDIAFYSERILFEEFSPGCLLSLRVNGQLWLPVPTAASDAAVAAPL